MKNDQSPMALPQKSELKPTAATARNKKARGKRVAEAERVTPGTSGIKLGSTESAKYLDFEPRYYALSELQNGAR